jgi:hypothetical protein
MVPDLRIIVPALTGDLCAALVLTCFLTCMLRGLAISPGSTSCLLVALQQMHRQKQAQHCLARLAASPPLSLRCQGPSHCQLHPSLLKCSG